MEIPSDQENPEMPKQAFKDFVESLALHYGQDKFIAPGETTKKRLASWYDRVKHLPETPLEWMKQQITDNYDYFPRNLSKTMLSLWDLWLKKNPDMHYSKSDQDCPHCVNGWILAYPPDSPVPRGVRCGHCARSCENGIWQATVREIENRGWKVKSFIGFHEKSDESKEYLRQAMKAGGENDKA